LKHAGIPFVKLVSSG